LKAYCTKDISHDKFLTTAHEFHEWLVDDRGNFLDDMECLETSFKPDPSNEWTCAICRSKAVIIND
jgi:hypothetical protein